MARRHWARRFRSCSNGNYDSKWGWRQLYPRRNRTRLNGLWYCSSRCFEGALVRSFCVAQVAIVPGAPAGHRMPLGLLLLSRGHITDSHLRVALEAQNAGGHGRIGEWLVELGFATELQVTAALEAQWARPVFPGSRVASSACSGTVPLPLLENFRMLPVQFVAATRVLYIACSARVNYGVLYAIEQMLGRRTEPCIVSDRCLNVALECLPRSATLVIGSLKAGVTWTRWPASLPGTPSNSWAKPSALWHAENISGFVSSHATIARISSSTVLLG
jgi:hypothetical protein